MIRSGSRLRASRARLNPSAVVDTTVHLRSRSSRMVCTWGRIRRPLGAWMSWGMTRSARSPLPARSPRIRSRMASSGTASAMACRRASMPSPVTALTGMGREARTLAALAAEMFEALQPADELQPAEALQACMIASRCGSVRRSHLLITVMTGIFRSCSCRTHCWFRSAELPDDGFGSCADPGAAFGSDTSSVSHVEPPFRSAAVPSMTTMARSVRSMISAVFFTRSWPSSPSSSKPAVSMKTTGPTG